MLEDTVLFAELFLPIKVIYLVQYKVFRTIVTTYSTTYDKILVRSNRICFKKRIGWLFDIIIKERHSLLLSISLYELQCNVGMQVIYFMSLIYDVSCFLWNAAAKWMEYWTAIWLSCARAYWRRWRLNNNHHHQSELSLLSDDVSSSRSACLLRRSWGI